MTSTVKRSLALGLVVVSMLLVVPGLFLPVLTIRGVLTRDGIAQVAPMMLERGSGRNAEPDWARASRAGEKQ